jgi:hydrogenase maturation protease
MLRYTGVQSAALCYNAPAMTANRRIVILGIGNLLRGDDGVGVRVIEALEQRDLPDGVECIDGGTGGPTLMVHFEGARALILIDAVNLDAEPGTIRVFGLEEIEPDPGGLPLSVHDINILPMLELSRKLNQLPPVVRIIGIQPERFDIGDRLSEAVQVAVPKAVNTALSELAQLLR